MSDWDFLFGSLWSKQRCQSRERTMKRIPLLIIFALSLISNGTSVAADKQTVERAMASKSEAFKKSHDGNRTGAWAELQPMLGAQLRSVPRDRAALAAFFQEWLGPSEPQALERCKDLSLPGSQGIAGSVFAYQLRDEDGIKEDLVIDFRDPQAVRMRTTVQSEPPPQKTRHGQANEKAIAAAVAATEINPGGGSQDGSAKSGYSVQIRPGATEDRMRKAAQLTTLVSLSITGTQATDAWLGYLKGHSYLASLDLTSTSVTDQGLLSLSECTGLKWVTIRNCNVTVQGVKALQTALPKCEITFEK
jgi:hypothetical protein